MGSFLKNIIYIYISVGRLTKPRISFLASVQTFQVHAVHPSVCPPYCKHTHTLYLLPVGYLSSFRCFYRRLTVHGAQFPAARSPISEESNSWSLHNRTKFLLSFLLLFSFLSLLLFMEYAAGGSSVALTVISPTYGSSNGSSLLAPPPLHYSPFVMPSALHPSSGSPAGSAPPPPPPPPIMTTPTGPSRGLHHQPSMRVGITSPQPVGVYIGRDNSFFFSFRFSFVFA